MPIYTEYVKHNQNTEIHNVRSGIRHYDLSLRATDDKTSQFTPQTAWLLYPAVETTLRHYVKHYVTYLPARRRRQRVLPRTLTLNNSLRASHYRRLTWRFHIWSQSMETVKIFIFLKSWFFLDDKPFRQGYSFRCFEWFWCLPLQEEAVRNEKCWDRNLTSL
jgi:hypothetical protein